MHGRSRFGWERSGRAVGAALGMAWFVPQRYGLAVADRLGWAWPGGVGLGGLGCARQGAALLGCVGRGWSWNGGRGLASCDGAGRVEAR